MATTARGAFPYPLESDTADPAADLAALAARNAAVNALYVQVDQADHSDRPAAGQKGTIAWCSTHGEYWWDTGAAWVQINPRPTSTQQVGSPIFSASGFTDFASNKWPACSISVPLSGMVKVTISASIQNTNTSTSTVWAAWRGSGAATVVDTVGAVSAMGARVYASRSKLVTGMTPGATLTATPQWNISSGGSLTVEFDDGELLMEPVL